MDTPSKTEKAALEKEESQPKELPTNSSSSTAPPPVHIQNTLEGNKDLQDSKHSKELSSKSTATFLSESEPLLDTPPSSPATSTGDYENKSAGEIESNSEDLDDLHEKLLATEKTWAEAVAEAVAEARAELGGRLTSSEIDDQSVYMFDNEAELAIEHKLDPNEDSEGFEGSEIDDGSVHTLDIDNESGTEETFEFESEDEEPELPPHTGAKRRRRSSWEYSVLEYAFPLAPSVELSSDIGEDCICVNDSHKRLRGDSIRTTPVSSRHLSPEAKAVDAEPSQSRFERLASPLLSCS